MDENKDSSLTREQLGEVAGGAARGVTVGDPAFCAKSPYKQHHETYAGSGICKYCNLKIEKPAKDHGASGVAYLVNQGQ